MIALLVTYLHSLRAAAELLDAQHIQTIEAIAKQVPTAPVVSPGEQQRRQRGNWWSIRCGGGVLWLRYERLVSHKNEINASLVSSGSPRPESLWQVDAGRF